MSQTDEPRPPLPPFDLEGAVQKVRMAEDAWNSGDPHMNGTTIPGIDIGRMGMRIGSSRTTV